MQRKDEGAQCAFVREVIVARAVGVGRTARVVDSCQGKLAHFKVPRYVIFTDEFPMTVTGKIQKFKMREISVEELGLQQAAATRTA